MTVPLSWVQERDEAPQQWANTGMMMAIDSSLRVFQPQTGLFAAVRGLGMDLLNATPAVKHKIIQYAMGEEFMP